MTTLGKRIEQAMSKKGMSRRELAEALGVSTMTIGDLVNDKTKKPRNLIEIAEILGVKPKWLQTGATISINGNNQITGSSVTATVKNSLGSEQDSTLTQEEFDDKHSHRIDYLDVRAAAGMVNEFQNSDYPEIIRSVWLSDEGMRELVGRNNTNGLSIIIVPTDSMEPTIKKGSFVVIDTNVRDYIGDGIYAFSINGNLFIKRLQKRIKGGYIVISDNESKYKPEEMDDEFMNNAIFIGKFIRCWNIETVDL